MSETVKRQWLTDNEGVKVAPYTTMDQIIMPNGTRFENKYEEDIHNTMQLIYSDDNMTATDKMVTIDLTSYIRKIAVLITSQGGLYTITCWNDSIDINIINAGTQISNITKSGKELQISFQGIINLFIIK